MKNVALILGLVISSSLFGQMTLSGTAFGTCDCYTLTTTTYQAGSVWSPETIDLTNSFDFTFNINLGFFDGGADGMVFVLRQSGTSTGGEGSYLGYSGITNSIGIEVDTWNSAPEEISGDIPSDHIGMHANGVLNHDLVAANAIDNIEDGADHDFRVTWNPETMEMETFLDGESIFVYTGDIVASIFGGDSEVFFGWTAATGGASNIQKICIDLDADFEADDVSVCPGQEVSFTNTSYAPLIYNGTSVVEWSWNFGDGGASDIENPGHIYEAEGTETVMLNITNLVGCTDMATLVIDIDSIDIDLEWTDITCFGFDDGVATVTPVTGDAPYGFLWDDAAAQTTATASDLTSGTYTVHVTDAVGCQQFGTITITEPESLLLEEPLIVNATCGLDDGKLTLSAMGGIPDYEYSIDGGTTFFTDTEFTELADGPLEVQIRDANGCTHDEIVAIESEDLEVEMTFANVTCFGIDNGSGTATPAFDVGSCSFSWDDPLMQVTPTATGLAPGEYTVIVTHDEIGCSGTGTVTITEPPGLMVNEISFVNASCGVENGEIAIEISGGTLPYEYSINGGLDFFPLPVFDDLAPGDYSILVRDANGCEINDNVTIINVFNVPVILPHADRQDGCGDLEVNFSNLSDPALTALTEWHFGDGAVAEGEVVSHTYTAPGCYDIYMKITTFDGCTTETTFSEYICVWELPDANFTFSPENPSVMKNEVDFENLSENGASCEWDFGDGSKSSTIDPTHVYPEIGNFNYPVRLIAISDKLCRDTAYQYVYIDEVVNYFIPNTFTPDGDAFNQVFQPYFTAGFLPENYHMIVYNRWGELLWESYDYTVGWDGTFGGNLVQDGVYIWKLTFKENRSDKKHEDNGHFTILK